MVTISEVEKPGKRSLGNLIVRSLSFTAALLFLAHPAGAAAGNPPDGMSLEKLGDCSWQVTYRGRVYDLSPLTRQSLSRPLENDIRYVLQRVPEASARLDEMNRQLGQAKAQTYLASFFLGGLLIAKLFEKHSMHNDSDATNFHVGEAAAGGFFLAATLFSWRSSVRAKEELVNAVDEFNAHSPYKIEPASGGTIEPPAAASPVGPGY